MGGALGYERPARGMQMYYMILGCYDLEEMRGFWAVGDGDRGNVRPTDVDGRQEPSECTVGIISNSLKANGGSIGPRDAPDV